MAKAAVHETIVEVEEMVGHLDPESIHLPGIYVDKIVIGDRYDKPIEQMHLLSADRTAQSSNHPKRQKIAQRLVKEFRVMHNIMMINY